VTRGADLRIIAATNRDLQRRVAEELSRRSHFGSTYLVACRLWGGRAISFLRRAY
jgi:hypothetical protein